MKNLKAVSALFLILLSVRLARADWAFAHYETNTSIPEFCSFPPTLNQPLTVLRAAAKKFALTTSNFFLPSQFGNCSPSPSGSFSSRGLYEGPTQNVAEFAASAPSYQGPTTSFIYDVEHIVSIEAHYFLVPFFKQGAISPRISDVFVRPVVSLGSEESFSRSTCNTDIKALKLALANTGNTLALQFVSDNSDAVSMGSLLTALLSDGRTIIIATNKDSIPVCGISFSSPRR